MSLYNCCVNSKRPTSLSSLPNLKCYLRSLIKSQTENHPSVIFHLGHRNAQTSFRWFFFSAFLSGSTHTPVGAAARHGSDLPTCAHADRVSTYSAEATRPPVTRPAALWRGKEREIRSVPTACHLVWDGLDRHPRPVLHGSLADCEAQWRSCAPLG